MKQKNILLGVFLLLGTHFLTAQETPHGAPVASGGVAIGAGGNVSYSVGQVVYTTYGTIGASSFVAQGVQQPFEISVDTALGINNAISIELLMSVYPNPTDANLTLKTEYFKSKGLHYQLFDAAGRLITSQRVTDEITLISTNNLVPAAYFLRVSDEKMELKNFKIIKN